MPLLDHFHAPLHPTRPWESFHSRWANSIGDHLNRALPSRYVAEIGMHFGSEVATDVAELEHLDKPGTQQGNGGAALAVQTWALPVATFSIPAVFPDDLEVQVVDLETSRLVAVVELVSPSNKDRTESRRGFAGKCAAYLQRGIGLVVIDVVTTRHVNLHNDLLDLLGQEDTPRMAKTNYLYANAYQPLNPGDNNGRIDLWVNALTVGGGLPTVPLALKGAWPIPLDLDATYAQARERSRL
jgi:hypothetical protein